MLFNSGDFLIFFPIVVLAFYILPDRMKRIWLLVASYFFYMCWNFQYALLLFASTFISFSGGICLDIIKNRSQNNILNKKKLIVFITVGINLAFLFYFKYVNFFISLIQRLLQNVNLEINIPSFDVILPIGISFYIFQAIGYLVDVYRDEIEAEKNFFKYALFISFFPQLVAGPIERSKNMFIQLNKWNKFSTLNLKKGFQIMLWGYFLKLVIADRCSILVDYVYSNYENFIGYQLIIANIAFAIQIYCDFMGYSLIAKGAAKILGIELMNNFRQPYFATSIKDFWRRWHISLSTWFRDYFYIPLGGNRKSKYKKYRNVCLTFMMSGLWHGASLTFVVWGIIHGLYQIMEDCFSPIFDRIIEKYKIKTNVFSWKVINILKTFILVDIAWVFFRAESVASAIHILSMSLRISNLGLILNDGLYELGLNTTNMNILFLALIVLVLASVMKEQGKNLLEWLATQNVIFRYALYWGAMIMIILSLDITGQEFIYFQF